MEFELADYEPAVQPFKHFTTRTTHKVVGKINDDKKMKKKETDELKEEEEEEEEGKEKEIRRKVTNL